MLYHRNFADIYAGTNFVLENTIYITVNFSNVNLENYRDIFLLQKELLYFILLSFF